MQGLAGAGIGALAGAAFALSSNTLHFGLQALTTATAADITISILTATGVGCLLSVVGVLYPAFVAARMQPVEAMRVEH
jgi:ABC-type antimicrobial peptide transport system permease subunit